MRYLILLSSYLILLGLLLLVACRDDNMYNADGNFTFAPYAVNVTYETTTFLLYEDSPARDFTLMECKGNCALIRCKENTEIKINNTFIGCVGVLRE